MWLIDRHYWQRFDPTYQYCIPDCRVIKRIIRSCKYIGTLWERKELCLQFYSLEKEGRQLPWQKGSFPLHLEEARHVLDCDPTKSYPGSQENEQVASVTSPEQFIPPWGGEKSSHKAELEDCYKSFQRWARSFKGNSDVFITHLLNSLTLFQSILAATGEYLWLL